MNYISTRGRAGVRSFEDVLLAGLASDGGLFVPETWPSFAPGFLEGLAGKSYQEVAVEVMLPFLGDSHQPGGVRRPRP